MKLVVSLAAHADFERLRNFLKGSPAAALQAGAALDDAMHSLEIFPSCGRPASIAGLRELIVPFGRSAYVPRYAIFADMNEIVVVRVWHAREARE